MTGFDRTLTHTLSTPYQASETAIHVLQPDDPDHSTNRVMYVLPVEPHDGEQCGDALAEIRKLDLHNRHQLICVKPTFSHPPWYADHPTDPHILQESHFLKVVVPFVDQLLRSTDFQSVGVGEGLSGSCTDWKSVLREGEGEETTRAAPERLLLGFSKSGWGAFSLLLRHPELFARAAAFDAPLAWETPTRYGMGEVFETQANMDRYCVVDLINRSVETLAGEPRLALYGYSDFRSQHQFLHYHMLKLGIPHEFQDGPRREHRWDSGWLPAAVQFLACPDR